MTAPDRAPTVDLAHAGALVTELWGLVAPDLSDLASHQDRNVLVESGGLRWVLKVANTAVPPDALDAQNAAMMALAGLPLRTPTPVASRAGRLREQVALDGVTHQVRLLTWVPGTPLTERTHLAPPTARRVGALAGKVSLALSSFSHPGAHADHQWDVRHSGQVVTDLRGTLDGPTAARVLALAASADAGMAHLFDTLPMQVVHGDITDFNVVADPGIDGRPIPAGLIDFGDLVHTWRASEVAVTICALLGKDRRDPLRVAEAVLAGFLAEQPLTDDEVDAVWPMVAARACAGLVSTAHQLTNEPDNDYLHHNLAVDRAALDAVESIGLPIGTLAMRRAAGRPIAAMPSLPIRALMLPQVDQWVDVDLSTTSPLLDAGAWREPGTLRAAVLTQVRALPTGTTAVIRHCQAHPHKASTHDLAEPATVHIGADVLLPRGSTVRAPWAGVLSADEPWVTRLVGDDGWDLVLAGTRPLRSSGADVGPGAAIAEVTRSRDPALPDHVHLTVLPTGMSAPTHVPASQAALWRALSPDPAGLLGLPQTPPTPDPHDLMRRRHAVLADVQEHYWADPPQMERGWRHHLVDVSGRVYLDGINNVAVLGHSHPAVADAVDRALRALNTNSRFHYAAHVEFAEQLLATMPAGLERVFLLSSGSEAVDLALRLARVHTGARDTIALRTAYHGWTTASDEVSSALMDNPRALNTRPDWVHLAEPPNPYRGPFTDADAGTRYAQDVRRILAGLASRGRRPAAFLCEPLNGAAGGVELPGDYLAEVYADVRAAGAVVIADEVQVGYGRLGSHFWGFEMFDVVPDIVCLAKATGNGYPVSAVVCTTEIAESFAAEGSLFASMGGTPAGAAAASATLQALRDEDLMGNAARMGARLRAGLEGLVDRHEMAGAVHGRGLYLGLELVTDKASRTPASAATDALCERLLRLGVVMAATGDHSNVLKIKPPLCIDTESVDFLLEALEVAFAEGW